MTIYKIKENIHKKENTLANNQYMNFFFIQVNEYFP